jgi:DNA replication protein DnaC
MENCPPLGDALVDSARARGDPGRIHGTVHNGDDAVAGLAKAHGERRLDEKLLALSKPKLLIVDELGYLCRWSPTRRTCSSSWSAGATKPAPC